MKPEEQEALDDLAWLFPAMACGEVQTLKQNLIDIRLLYNPRKTKKIREMLPQLERLKKQGVLFGYPLVSDVITHLETLIRKTESVSENEFSFMLNDVLLMQEILWKKIRGDGGEKGQKILKRLSRIPK